MLEHKKTLNKKQCELLIMLQELSKKVKATNPYLIFFENKSESSVIDLFFVKNRNGEYRLCRLLRQAELPDLPDSIYQVADSLNYYTFRNYNSNIKNKAELIKCNTGDSLSEFNQFRDESIKKIVDSLLQLSVIIDEYVSNIQEQYSSAFFEQR